MGKQKCISKDNGRNFGKYDKTTGKHYIFTPGQGRTRQVLLFGLFFLRQVSIFHCEIASVDEAEFTNFLCTAEQPIPNSNPHEPYCSVFVAHVAWKLSLDSQIC